jgi:hypothetical protein
MFSGNILVYKSQKKDFFFSNNIFLVVAVLAAIWVLFAGCTQSIAYNKRNCSVICLNKFI